MTFADRFQGAWAQLALTYRRRGLLTDDDVSDAARAWTEDADANYGAYKQLRDHLFDHLGVATR
jgi:hypothetical protein